MPASDYSLGGYSEAAPPADLSRVIEAVWRYELPLTADAGTMHRVVPDAAASLSWRVQRDRHGDLSDARVELIGPNRSPRLYRPEPGVSVVAVRLFPEWTRAVLDADPGDLRDLVVEAPPRSLAAGLRDELLQAVDGEMALRRLVAFVAGRSARSTSESAAGVAVDTIRRDWRSIRDIAKDSGVSERHLRRLVSAATGMSPRYLARIRRMHALVKKADRSASPRWAELAVESGFYDQPHMIEEIRELTGRTPGQLHAERRAQRALD